MDASLDLLLGLLEQDDNPSLAAEDFNGGLGDAIQAWQAAGFLTREPSVHPCPSCPYCEDGVPYSLGPRVLCNSCHSDVDPKHLLLWPLDRDAFLRWLSPHLGLRGQVRRVDTCLWQLGTWVGAAGPLECFYRRPGSLSDFGRTRLQAFRSVLVVYGLTRPMEVEGLRCRCFSLLELLRADGPLAVADLSPLLRTRGNVRFDAHSGALWAGDDWLGDVPVGSKEYHFLCCLSEHLDHFVPYADVKREVLRRSGGSDSRDEATFAHRLKNRIKKTWIGTIDLVLVTTNKADGYRLRAWVEA